MGESNGPRAKIAASHWHLLVSNNIDRNDITNDNVIRILNSLKSRKQKELSANYKISILRTIKHELTNITVTPKQLKVQRRRNYNALSANLYENIIKIITYAYNLNFNYFESVMRSDVDLAIGLLVISSTSANSRHFHNFTFEHFERLVEVPTRGVTVGHDTIIINELMWPHAKGLISDAYAYRVNRFDSKYRMRPINSQLLVSCSNDVLNKKLKELYVQLISEDPPKHLGFQTIKKNIKDVVLSNIKINVNR